ncbi:molybdopterin-dependent oxidoreductase [Enhygromyxa salina]|uniref:Aldehyde oxidoreductase n=1 Tax=Enhygromyxa salina TaxID=215803 RepID=A0A2S9YIC6_9BACT|nr:molybdopterin-dependent oxidoreductase [Enhygromyxa salina]PRQ04868.1 Aldehyde oxidoreductase [Enhygromyxa salina]
MQTTRRGFLKSTVAGATATVACAKPQRQTAVGTHPKLPESAPTTDTVELNTHVNGERVSLRVGADHSTLNVVREQLGLTGSKLGCGHGACGACTMQLDGTPVATCLLPATKLEGRQLHTVEGIGPRSAGGQLHPIQRAFMAEDALQCGYCTPGFIVESAAFHDRFRAKHGAATPSRDEIAAALSGHLCRCGAYVAIYRAVAGACAGKFDDGPDQGPRIDALAKVTGAAKYSVDIAPEGLLIAKVLRSPHAHAKLGSIDWSGALAHPGVVGAIELTRPGHKLRYVGQEIVALAAIDEATAIEALTKVHVEYELLPAVLGLDAPLEPNAPELYAEKKARKAAPNANETPLLPETWRGNLRGPFELFSHNRGRARRRVERARDGEGELYSGSFETQVQLHTPLEPKAAVAEWLSADKLRVHASSQGVRQMAEDIATRWGLRHEDVEVIADYVGGGFGAKGLIYIEMVIAIELARVCGQPVKYANDRREELAVGGSRPGLRTTVSVTGAMDTLPAFVIDSRSDAGVAVGSSASILARINYPQADQHLSDYDVLNNAPPSSPFRGPGGPPMYFAIEQAIDALAITHAVDPIALRSSWNENDSRQRVYDWASAHPMWQARRPARSDTGRFRRGIGIATASWWCLAEPATRVQIDASRDGVVISTACQDMGNGSRTLLADVVADVLGVDPHSLTVKIGSSKAVHGPMSGGSRTATSLGPAATDAAIELRDELVEVARRRLKLANVRPIAGGVEHDGGRLTWTELLEVAPAISVTGKRGRDQGGFVLPPIADLAFSRYLSATVQISEVEVDTRLGRVRMLRSACGVSVGKIYSPLLARSQAEGGLVQGISYALFEERRLDPRHGTLLTGGLEDYRLCGLGDIGEIEVEFVPGGFERVRGQGVGIGELATLTPAATIANAVYDATGWRPTHIPLRPDRVLAGLAQTSGAQP